MAERDARGRFIRTTEPPTEPPAPDTPAEPATAPPPTRRRRRTSMRVLPWKRRRI